MGLLNTVIAWYRVRRTNHYILSRMPALAHLADHLANNLVVSKTTPPSYDAEKAAVTYLREKVFGDVDNSMGFEMGILKYLFNRKAWRQDREDTAYMQGRTFAYTELAPFWPIRFGDVEAYLGALDVVRNLRDLASGGIDSTPKGMAFDRGINHVCGEVERDLGMPKLYPEVSTGGVDRA